MRLYAQLTGSQLGSSAIFGTLFFAAFASDGVAEAATAGALAAASWFATLPLLRRVIGAAAGA